MDNAERRRIVCQRGFVHPPEAVAPNADQPSDPGADPHSAEHRTGIDFMLGPATRLLWRSPAAVHFEIGSRAVLVEGLPAPLVRRVAALDARRSVSAPAGHGGADHHVAGHHVADRGAGGTDRPDESARHALVALAEAGYLWPRADQAAQDDPRVAAPAPLLAGELTALAARHGTGAAELLNARRHASVQICGAGRIGAHLASVLAAAGVGHVHCAANGDAKLRHALPGGITPADEGARFSVAAEQAVLRAAPSTDTRPPPADERPDLTVLVLDEPISDERRQALHAAAAPHLALTLTVDAGVVGPLVLPGLTSCLRCADLHRQDRDPAWSALAVQLTVGSRYGPASDAGLATALTGVAALQTLAFLDGGEPAVLDATLELQPPDWRLRRRSWPLHPSCDCTDN